MFEKQVTKMNSDIENKFSFEDESINKVSKKVLEKSKAGFESHQEVFNRINSIKPEESGDTLQNKENPQKTKGDVSVPNKEAGETKKEPYPIKSLRTYQGDIAEAIKKENTSVLSITLAEKKRREEKEKKEPQVKKKNKEVVKHIAAISVSIFLIVLGVSAVVGFYLLQKNNPVEEIASPIDTTIAPFDKKVVYGSEKITRDTLLEITNSLKKESSIGGGEILYIALAKNENGIEKAIDGQTFFSKIKTRAPGNLIRSFDKNFMLGIYNVGTLEPFMLIGLSSFENAYAGMLDWEKDIYNDLGVFFSKNTLRINEEIVQMEESTTTPENSSSTSKTRFASFEPEINSKFEDITIKNKDARILKNSRGDIVLLYSFIDKDTILISADLSVFREMINKITASKLIR